MRVLSNKNWQRKCRVFKQIYINPIEFRFKLRSKEKQQEIIDSLKQVLLKYK